MAVLCIRNNPGTQYSGEGITDPFGAPALALVNSIQESKWITIEVTNNYPEDIGKIAATLVQWL